MKLLAKSTVAVVLLASAVTALESDAASPVEAERLLRRKSSGTKSITKKTSFSSKTFSSGGKNTFGRSQSSSNLKSLFGSFSKKQGGKRTINPNFFKGGFSNRLKQTPQQGRQGCASRVQAKKEAEKEIKGKVAKVVRKGKRKGRKAGQPPKYVKPKSNLEIVGGKCVSDHVCAEVRGDPHIKTFDGVSYDCQGQGEFVLAKSKSTAFEIQARFGAPDNGKTKAVTITKAISIDTGVEGAPQLDLFIKNVTSASNPKGTCVITWYVDGKLVEDGFGDDGLKYDGIEFFADVTVNDKEVFDYAYFTDSGLMYSVLPKSGSFGCVLNSKICLPPSMSGDDIFGLLGTPNGNKQDEWKTRYGGAEPLGASKGSEPFNYCTTQHCVVSAEESIFGYEDGTSFADYNKCGEAYDDTAEQMVDNPSIECEECCSTLKASVDGYESCLLECMEGGEEACVDEIINEEVLAEAQNQCPDSKKPPTSGPKSGPKKGPPKPPTPVCRATGRTEGKMYELVRVSGAYKLNSKGGIKDVLPGTEVTTAEGETYIVTSRCQIKKVDPSGSTSMSDSGEETPECGEGKTCVPICKFIRNGRGGLPTYKMEMGSLPLKNKDSQPGEEVPLRRGKIGILNDKCVLERKQSSSSSEEVPPPSSEEVPPPSSEEEPSSEEGKGGPSSEDKPKQCKNDRQCPQPRCAPGFPCFRFTCEDGECVKSPPSCSKEGKKCSDGSVVYRSGPRCRFAACPPETPDEPSTEDRTTKKAFTKGDPHFKTFGGELYDYHGECDLVLLHNPDFKEGLGMDIHIRTKIQDFWSSVESAAIKLGDDTMEIRADPSSDEWLWFNGKEATSALVDGEWYKHEVAGFLVRYKQTGENTREANLYLKGAKEVLVMKTFKSFVRIDVNWQESDNYFNSVGLLGAHAHEGKRLGRDGEFIEDANAFGQDWQVIPEVDGSLFHSYEGAVVGKQCVMPPTYQPGMNVSSLAEQRRRLGESTLDTEMAEKACNHLVDPEEIKACVFDVVATQDLNMASTW